MSIATTIAEENPTISRYAGEDAINPTGNLVVFFIKRATDIESEFDESLLPDFLQRYCEYGAISRAYKANTDGRIQSLADYWDMRKKAGIVAIKRFMAKRLADREYRLESARMNSGGKYRHPRLPDEYPEVYP